MSHQDPNVRRMMRAQKALKSAITNLNGVPSDMKTPELQPTIDRARKLLDADVKVRL
jgi:hypothetical protein